MLLPRDFVAYLSRQIVRRLSPVTIGSPNPERIVELVNNLIEAELNAEDALNDEVRDLLEQYSDYMRKEGVSYQDMFRKIKNTMIQQRKIVKASGRDTGDAKGRKKITSIHGQVLQKVDARGDR